MGLLSIENIALNQICAYAKNAKNHPEGQVQQIAASCFQRLSGLDGTQTAGTFHVGICLL